MSRIGEAIVVVASLVAMFLASLLALAWLVVLPTVGLLYVCGFIS